MQFVEQCRLCRWYYPECQSRPLELPRGVCRRFPRWVSVSPGHHCGEFTKKEDV